jgi:hypothetical protein
MKTVLQNLRGNRIAAKRPRDRNNNISSASGKANLLLVKTWPLPPLYLYTLARLRISGPVIRITVVLERFLE